MAPIRHSPPSCSILSSPQRDRSIPMGAMRLASLSHIMPPMTVAPLVSCNSSYAACGVSGVS